MDRFTKAAVLVVKNAEMLLIYSILTAFGVVLILQARSLYYKLKPQEDPV